MPEFASFRGVSIRAEDGTEILREVTTTLHHRRTAVIGANGSGKSSFARLLNGLRLASQGEVTVLGLDPSKNAKQLRQRVGFVFTNPEAQILMPTPAEDVALSLSHLPKKERAARAGEVLANFGLSECANRPVSSLSGGQRQLLALAAVLATEPEFLIADEPTTLLDLRNSRQIGELLLHLDIPIVLVTHDLDLAARCDHALLFDEGRLSDEGEPEAVISRYRALCG